jgi:hypothetical protein
MASWESRDNASQKVWENSMNGHHPHCVSASKPSKLMTQETIDHHKKAAEHHIDAARHNKEAANHYASGSHEKARHHAHLALGHHLHATYHAEEAAKYPAEEDNS